MNRRRTEGKAFFGVAAPIGELDLARGDHSVRGEARDFDFIFLHTFFDGEFFFLESFLFRISCFHLIISDGVTD